MYRNIVYRINTEEGWQGEIDLYTWDDDGKRVKYTVPHNSHLYYIDSKGEYKSLYGDKLKKKIFSNVASRKKWLNEHTDLKIFECLNPVQEFLQQYFRGHNKDIQDFTRFKTRNCFLDIEVAIEDEFPEPSLANYPINLITFHDSFTNKYYTLSLGYLTKKDLGLNEIGIKEEDVELNCYDSEYKLLKDFIKLFKVMEFDVLSGWNSAIFDVPYIINRCYKILGEFETNKLSATGKFNKVKISSYRSNYEEYGYSIPGIASLDYMQLYKNFIVMMEGDKPSFKLEDICQEDLGYGKVHYEGSMKQFYKNNWNLFVRYNIQDVKLLVELNVKRKLLQLTRMLCCTSLIEFEKVNSSLQLSIGSMLQCSDLKIPSIRNYDDLIDASYPGGYVKDPISGVYDKGVASFDVASLYPNIMISNNISPETYFGIIIEENGEDIVIRTSANKIINTTKTKLENTLLKTGKFCKTANGALFNKKDIGIIPIFLKEGFKERLKYKNKIKRLRKELNNITNEKHKIKINDKIDELDMIQFTKKIFLNATYGIMGNKYNPFFNINIAAAITTTGQYITKTSGEYIDNYIKHNYPCNDTYTPYIYSDTDSIYVDVRGIVYNIANGKINNKTLPNILRECKKINKVLDNFAGSLCKEKLYSLEDNRINFEQETFCDIVVMFKKRRYMLHIIDEDGNKCDKFKYKGISVTRSTYPEFAKGCLKEVFEKSLKEKWDENKFIDYMSNLYNQMKQLDFKEISLNKNLNKYKESEDFLGAQKGTAGHAKAALYYNQLLDKLELNNKYSKVTQGKIKLCYIKKSNKFGIPVIAFDDTIPEEFRKIFEIDYRKMFDMLFNQPLDNYRLIQGWREFDFNNYTCDIMDL